jgi:hypothetical protein
MNTKAPRARAIDQTTAPTFLSTTTPNRFWNSDVWDGQAWNCIQGTFYAGASCNVVLRQAQASGYWDYQTARDVLSGTSYVISEPLVGRYVQAVVTTVSGKTPTVFRFGLWGKQADNGMLGYHHASGDYKQLAVDQSGQMEIAVSVVADNINVSLSGGMVMISGQPVIEGAYTAIVANPVVLCTTDSGGTILNSSLTASVLVRALEANNGDVYLGGASGTAFVAFSGFGLTFLCPGDPIVIPLKNPNLLTACATASGDRLVYGGAR